MNTVIQREVSHLLLVVKRIEEMKVDLTVEYDDWVTVCLSLCDLVKTSEANGATEEDLEELKQTALQCFLRVSALNPGYAEEECRAKFQNCIESSLGAVKLGSFYQLAADHGVDISKLAGRPKGAVLIGEQGKYKTTWLDRLMPPELKAYRCKQTAMENMDKDEQIRAAEYGLINLDEMDKLSERGLNAIKSLFTNTEIDQRAPYAYGKEKRIRIASYVASGNKEQFLTDSTGNRRWLPFTVDEIDSPYEHEFPYQGMYAQGVWLLEHGFNYWITSQETADMSEHVNSYMVPQAEADLVSVYFEPVEKGAVDALALTLPEIRAKLISWGNLKHAIGISQLGIIMNNKGFRKIRPDKNGPRLFLVREKNADYINAQRRQMAR